MTFDGLLANLRYASTSWWKVNKNKISLNLVVVFCLSITKGFMHPKYLENVVKNAENIENIGVFLNKLVLFT